ncbi:hypothetical protein VKT23_003478 [Stygiomarasmius scandens]|uniref:Fungal-type protein kinase domain-containing protein n=1 Tax=Marasmiellus scandens TaxID=2682957 RepID=A0ABR1K0D4_9AGAR
MNETEIQNGLCGTFRKCGVEDWLHHFASFANRWEEPFLNSMLDSLKHAELFGEDGWAFMREAEKEGCNEDETFEWVQNVAEHLVEAAKSRSEQGPTTVIQNTPSEPIQSEAIIPPPNRRRSQRLATLARPLFAGENKILLKETSQTAWACAAEFKLVNNEKNRIDNEQKICGGATELIYNDPTRRFVHGLTIEGDVIRLWRFDRCQTCVSDDLDYHREPLPFICFLLFILFAPSTELGFDPTVRRREVEDGGRTVIAYQYQVEGRFFLTQGNPISEDAAYFINSRSTRVWTAKEVFFLPSSEHFNLSEEVYVIKDAYLFEEADLEQDIQRKIFAKLRELDDTNASEGNSTQYYEEAKPYFLEILMDSVVDLSCGSSDPQLDITPDVLTVPAVFTGRSPYSLPKLTEGSQRVSQRDVEKNFKHDPPPPNPIETHRRKHIRTVFKERCQSVYELTDAKAFVRCLRDATKGLMYLRLAGYVHRDISAGNCLWHGHSGTGKIADLEYSRPFDQLSNHDPRMGTPAFMAAEYQSHDYLFLKESVKHRKGRVFTETKSPSQTNIAFVFNFYHDLESIFWVCLWFLVYRPPEVVYTAIQNVDGTFKANLSSLANKYLSCGVGGNSERNNLLLFDRHMDSLQDLLLDGCGYQKCRFLVHMTEVIAIMKEAYTKLENSDPRHWSLQDFEVTWHKEVIQIFQVVLEALPEGPLPVRRIISAEGKRSLVDGESEEQRELKKVKR